MKAIFLCLLLSGCACTANTGAAVGIHTIKGWDAWSLADTAVTAIMDAEECK